MTQQKGKGGNNEHGRGKPANLFKAMSGFLEKIISLIVLTRLRTLVKINITPLLHQKLTEPSKPKLQTGLHSFFLERFLGTQLMLYLKNK